jgi:SAM-dependent MidA family methyltransferase
MQHPLLKTLDKTTQTQLQTHMQSLFDIVKTNIKAAGGHISFYDYMQQALYYPQLGYYKNSLHKLGEGGDFITAPEISSLFAYCLAQQACAVFAECESPSILEFGAGTGRLAADMLNALADLEHLPTAYYILEVSGALRSQQQATVKRIAPEHAHRVIWLDRLPESPLQGMIVANEVLDAMPVRRFACSEERMTEVCVQLNTDETALTWVNATNDLTLPAELAEECADLPVGYCSEYNPVLDSWMQSLSQCLQKGLVLLIDYGFPRHEYYHPQRHDGTLMCHFRHHSHADPLVLLGIQDITAHVDFTSLAEAGLAADFELAGYTSQAEFLLASGLEQHLLRLESQRSAEEDVKAHLMFSKAVQKLLLPGEMGELFKVMGFHEICKILFLDFNVIEGISYRLKNRM